MEIKNEEIKKELIDAVEKELMSRELNKALGKTQDYFEDVAKKMIEQNPGKTAEEIGDIYEEMCMKEERSSDNKENEVSSDERN